MIDKKYYIRYNKDADRLEQQISLTGSKPRGYGWVEIPVDECCNKVSLASAVTTYTIPVGPSPTNFFAMRIDRTGFDPALYGSIMGEWDSNPGDYATFAAIIAAIPGYAIATQNWRYVGASLLFDSGIPNLIVKSIVRTTTKKIVNNTAGPLNITLNGGAPITVAAGAFITGVVGTTPGHLQTNAVGALTIDTWDTAIANAITTTNPLASGGTYTAPVTGSYDEIRIH